MFIVPVSSEEIVKAIGNPIIEAFDVEGITPKRLAKKLKAELNARETKVLKIKSLKQGPKNPDGSPNILEVEEIAYSKPLTAWDIRQKARQDAHKLRGDYPPEKREFSGPGGEPIPVKLYDFDQTKFPKTKTEGGNGGE